MMKQIAVIKIMIVKRILLVTFRMLQHTSSEDHGLPCCDFNLKNEFIIQTDHTKKDIF